MSGKDVKTNKSKAAVRPRSAEREAPSDAYIGTEDNTIHIPALQAKVSRTALPGWLSQSMFLDLMSDPKLCELLKNPSNLKGLTEAAKDPSKIKKFELTYPDLAQLVPRIAQLAAKSAARRGLNEDHGARSLPKPDPRAAAAAAAAEAAEKKAAEQARAAEEVEGRHHDVEVKELGIRVEGKDVPKWLGSAKLAGLVSDEKIVKHVVDKDPLVARVLKEISADPALYPKYAHIPEVRYVYERVLAAATVRNPKARPAKA